MTIAFEILSEIRDVETIAAGGGCTSTLSGPHSRHGSLAENERHRTVRVAGTICEAEIHWFEAHGIGRKDFKIKRVMR
jgi:hypothetical protein